MTVAITGGIAEGKSTLLGWLRDEGWPVCSADSIARDVLEDQAVNLEIRGILLDSGYPLPSALRPLPPLELRSAMLASPQVRRAVNRVLHPKIFGALNALRPPPSPLSPKFIEVPLLLEACLQTAYDRVWVVMCGPHVQRTRMQQRYRDPELIDALLATQLDTRVKCLFADRIFRTNEPESTVRASLTKAARELSV